MCCLRRAVLAARFRLIHPAAALLAAACWPRAAPYRLRCLETAARDRCAIKHPASLFKYSCRHIARDEGLATNDGDLTTTTSTWCLGSAVARRVAFLHAHYKLQAVALATAWSLSSPHSGENPSGILFLESHFLDTLLDSQQHLA